ncbi:MAG TPA: alpha/beta hydrolase [Nitrospiraceae bacterium]|nr:alpha/beta hydrolase [Nitrospiraceae bacterium]
MSAGSRFIEEQPVSITAGTLLLEGILGLPPQALGVVLFAHGSGSGRFSPRNNAVARVLQQGRLATLLLDLLMPDEANDRRKVFDIHLLADRLLIAKGWLARDSRTGTLPLGYFGASTGAGAALEAGATDPGNVRAIVSRGGRPDLAERHLALVRAPTLLLVGGDDVPVIEMNRSALARLTCKKDLVIIPGASHLFEEPGTLELVAQQALQWFLKYLPPNTDARHELEEA